MDLQQTIADLEKQAAQYTEAANALRVLLAGQSNGAAAPATSTANEEAPTARRRGRQPGSKNKTATTNKSGRPKKVVSPETRAKIAAAIKASHETRRAAREQAAASDAAPDAQ